MTETVQSAQPAALTPSETVILFGDRFAPEAGMLGHKDEALTSGKKVDAAALVVAAVRAAVFAAVEAGALAVEMETQKALLGLVKRQRVRVRAGSAQPAFPAGSLEDAIAQAAQRGPGFLQDVVIAMISSKSHDPAGRLLTMAKAGMAGRGLLEAEEKRTLKVFTTLRFTLPDATRAAAELAGPAAARGLLDRAQTAHPAVWDGIQSEVKNALNWMTESND